MSHVESKYLTEDDDDIPFRYVKLGNELSEYAEKGVKKFEDGKVVFSIGGEKPIDISLRVTAFDPLDPSFSEEILEGNEPIKVWQPEIKKGKKTGTRRFYVPDHGLTETAGTQAGLLEGAYYDIFDYVVMRRGLLLGATVEFNGDLSHLLSHDKRFRVAGIRPVPSEPKDNRYFSTQGPEHQRSELVFARDGFAVTAMWDRFPTARELIEESPGNFAWDQRYHRAHRLKNYQNEVGISRIRGVSTRLLDAAEQVHQDIEPFGMFGGHILRVTVWDTREELIPYQISQVLGYKSRNYAEKIAGKDNRCPVSGHPVDLDPSWEDFGSVVQRKNRIGIPPDISLPVVRFTIAFVSPNPQQDLKEVGQEVDSCRDCFPTICFGLHENTSDEAQTLCPGCNRVWREDHICSRLTGSVHPNVYFPGDSITLLEERNVDHDLTGMSAENVELLESLYSGK